MEKIAYVFAGQGSQYIGMGAEFSDHPLFQQLSEHWSIPLADLFSEQPYWETHPFALQSMIATTSLVIASVVQKMITPAVVAGLSLGEYSALAFANAIEAKPLWKVLDQRSQWMEQISLQSPSQLLVVIGLSRDEVTTVLSRFQEVYIANHNAPDQVVIGSKAEIIESIKETLLHAGARRCVKLPVVVASHTPFMQPLVSQMRDFLEQVPTTSPAIPVVSNVTGVPHDELTWKSGLSKQLSSTVEWVRSIEWMVQQGITTFIEIGPGKVLSGLIQKIHPDAFTYSVNTLEDVLLLKSIKDKGGFK